MSSASLPGDPPFEITQLLVAWREGSDDALERLIPLVEPELRRLARQYLRRERPGHMLQTTALVNEAFIRLMNWKDVGWQNRGHFLAMVARLMRHILVDISRRRAKDDAGRQIRIVDLGEANGVTVEPSRELLAIDEALHELAKHDPRKAQIVEMRFFGGLTLDEIADALEVAPITVSREWAKARAWLHREVRG